MSCHVMSCHVMSWCLYSVTWTPLVAAAAIRRVHFAADASLSASRIRILSAFSLAHLSYKTASISMYYGRHGKHGRHSRSCGQISKNRRKWRKMKLLNMKRHDTTQHNTTHHTTPHHATPHNPAGA